MIDIARFSIAPVSQDRDIPKKPGRNTLAGGRASRSVLTPEQRRAVKATIGRRTIRDVHARRGVTLWHKVAMSLAEAPEDWQTAGVVWRRIPQAMGVTPRKVSIALSAMARCGRVERVEIPGRDTPGRMRPGRNGGVFWVRAPRWAYRITARGLAQAEEGRRRVAEGRPSEATRPGRCGTPRKPPRGKPGWPKGKPRKPRLAEQVEGAEHHERDEQHGAASGDREQG